MPIDFDTVTLGRADNKREGGEEGHIPLNNGIQTKGRGSLFNF